MKFLRSLIFASVILALCAPGSFAMVYLPEEKIISSVVVSEDQYLSPGAVTVIRPDDYKGEYNTVASLLERVPGVTVINSGVGVEMAMIRGSHQKTVAVYMDGISMNTTNDNMYPMHLENIPYDQIERIEVYKGFVPARFGHQAMGGVINIVTKMPAQKETNASVSVGSYGRFKTAISHAVPLGDGILTGSLGYESYNGDFDYFNGNQTPADPTDDYKAVRTQQNLDNLNLMLKWSDENWRARFAWNNKKYDSMESTNSTYGIPPFFEKPGTPWIPAEYDWTNWEFSLGRTQTHGSLTWGWDIAYRDQNSEYKGFDQLDGSVTSHSDYGFKRTTVGLHGEIPLGEHHLLNAVGEYVYEKYAYTDHQYPTGSEYTNLEEYNFNIQDEIVLDKAGTFLAVPSLRYNKVGDDGRFTWQIAFQKEFQSNLTFKTSYGTYARLPNTFERYGGSDYYLPNPDLKTETGEQFDAGISWKGVAESLGNARVDAALTAYWRETKDLIDIFYVNDGSNAQYQNIYKSKVKGIELATALDWKKWNIFLSAGYTDSSNENPADPSLDGRRRSNLPYWNMTARLTRRFDRGSAFAEYQHTGDYFVDNNNWRYTDASDVFNLGIKYDFNDTFGMIVGVNDVFDETNGLKWRDEQQPGWWTPNYPQAGRTFYVTLESRF